ncbi:MAG: transcriptional regulator [Mycobacterium sp.]|nr:transcriptional regulator [Mycobacterium sp.]
MDEMFQFGGVVRGGGLLGEWRYSCVVPPRESPASRPRLTSRGAATRGRMVLAAAELMHVQGVAATTIDEVLAASATSKSQFYQHFDDKSELVYEVITLQADEVLAWQRLRLEKVDSFRGLYQWRDAMVQRCVLRRGFWGCELGSLASELSDTDDKARASLSEHFAEWRGMLAAALERMRDSGVLRAEIDPPALATGLLAAVEGGYLLSQTAHDPRPMQMALNMAIDHVKSFSAVTTATD